MNKLIRLILLGIGACFMVSITNVCLAVDCLGYVSSLSLQLNQQGTVTVSLSNSPSYTYLCDIDGQGRNGVSPDVCRVMYSTLMAAKLANKQVSIRFYDYENCASVPAWTNAGTLGWTILLTD